MFGRLDSAALLADLRWLSTSQPIITCAHTDGPDPQRAPLISRSQFYCLRYFPSFAQLKELKMAVISRSSFPTMAMRWTFKTSQIPFSQRHSPQSRTRFLRRPAHSIFFLCPRHSYLLCGRRLLKDSLPYNQCS